MKTFKLLSIVFSVMCFSSSLFSQWTIIQNSGLPDSQNPTLVFSAVDSNICWGIQRDIKNPKGVITIDGGDHWSLIQLPVDSGLTAVSIAALNKDIAWITLDDHASATSGGVFKTTNGGIDWIKQGSAFPGAGAHPVNIYFFDADNGLCTGEPRSGYWEIYTTTDGGTNWVRVPSANIPAVASDDFIGFGTAAGNSFWVNSASCRVYRTTDKGLTWSVSPNVFPNPAYFVQVAFKDTLNGLAISYFGDEINKVSRSTDGGESWTWIAAPYSQPSNGSPTYVPGSSGTYFIVASKNIGFPEPTVPGSIYTPDDGLTWHLVDNLAHGPASFIDNKTGWSAGCGDTIFKWKSEFPIGIGDVNLSKRNVTLSQNYPNPFSSSTSIQFHIPISSKVILKLFDIQGREIETLVNEDKPAGSYNVNVESGGLSSGIYYYRLQVGESVQTKKLFIL
jgi:hypothetical protein